MAVYPIRLVQADCTQQVSPQQAKMQSVDHTPVIDAAVCSSPSLASMPALSPISSLLEELLIIILDDVITSESSSLSYQHARATTGQWPLSAPRRLASVSRTWRATVFACPTLWRYIHFTPAQPTHALKEHLCNSSPVPIHLTVHQWPLRSPIPASGPNSIAELTTQLQSILSPADGEDDPACQRVASVTINSTESSTFLSFVLQTWTGRKANFPALRRVTMNGNVCATWSRACFFDNKNAPNLEHLELSNVVIAYGASGLSRSVSQHLTTLVWSAPVHPHGALVVSPACFHHILSSFPNLVTLDLRGHVVGLEFATPESLDGSAIAPLTHVRNLYVSGNAFANTSAAYMLFYLLPAVRRLVVRGRAYSGPAEAQTVTLVLQALACLPQALEWPVVLVGLEDLVLECTDGEACDAWQTWCMSEVGIWRQWRASVANTDRAAQVRVETVMVDDVSTDVGGGLEGSC